MPTESELPGFKKTCESYHGAMMALVRKLVSAFALSLDLAAEYMEGKQRNPITIQRLLHYPSQEGKVSQEEIRHHQSVRIDAMRAADPRIDCADSAPPGTTPWNRFSACCRPPSLANAPTAEDRDRDLGRTNLFHDRRRQRTLSRLTPVEYKTIMTSPASQAA